MMTYKYGPGMESCVDMILGMGSGIRRLAKRVGRALKIRKNK